MPTNKPGYSRRFYHAEREKVVIELIQRGSCCEHAIPACAEIHHIEPLNGNRPNGRLDRLYEWRQNMDNLEALCPECHRKIHCGKEYWER